MTDLTKLNQKQYKEKIVLTTKELAEFYGVKPIKIQQNFNNNKNQYTENIDYILISKSNKEYSKFSNSENSQRPIYLWTESGALKHAKSIGTSEAWDVYNKLVKSYFKLKEIQEKQYNIPQSYAEALLEAGRLALENEKLEAEKQVLLPKANSYDDFMNDENLMTMNEVAKLLSSKGIDIGVVRLFKFLREEEILFMLNGSNVPKQPYIELGYFKVKEKMIKEVGNKPVTLVTKKGFEYIRKKVAKEYKK
jgi:phage antirepressor YoqD-like protein